MRTIDGKTITSGPITLYKAGGEPTRYDAQAVDECATTQDYYSKKTAKSVDENVAKTYKIT